MQQHNNKYVSLIDEEKQIIKENALKTSDQNNLNVHKIKQINEGGQK